MSESIKPQSTSALLRVLAKAIDDGNPPAFLVLMMNPEDSHQSTWDAGENRYIFLGALEEIKHDLIHELAEERHNE